MEGDGSGIARAGSKGNAGLLCRTCGRTALRLVAREGAYGCDICLGVHSHPNANLHLKAGNRWKPKMTVAEKLNITTRHKGADGMIHAAPRWESRDT